MSSMKTRLIQDPSSTPDPGKVTLNACQVKVLDLENSCVGIPLNTRVMYEIIVADISKFYFKIILREDQCKLCTFFAIYNSEDQEFQMGNKNMPWCMIKPSRLIMGFTQSPLISKCCII